MYKKFENNHVDTSRVKIFLWGRELPYTAFRFSAGEIQVRIPDGPAFRIADNEEIGRVTVHINMDYQTSDDIMLVLLIKDALCAMTGGKDFCVLVMKYLPYGRQDRACYPGEARAAQMLVKLLADAKFKVIVTWDAHSDKAFDYFPFGMIENVPASKFITDLIKHGVFNTGTVVVIPDKGAMERGADATAVLSSDGTSRYICMDKVRNPDTGALSGFRILGDNSQYSSEDAPTLLIVDDIADGGGTFIGMADVLKAAYPHARISLYVTHGIFSRGFKPFEGVFESIYVANRMWADDVVAPDFVHDMCAEGIVS